MKTYSRSGYEHTTIRTARTDSGAPLAIFGQVKDLQEANLIIGDYNTTADKWLLIPTDFVQALEFNSREELKAHLATLDSKPTR